MDFIVRVVVFVFKVVAYSVYAFHVVISALIPPDSWLCYNGIIAD